MHFSVAGSFLLHFHPTFFAIFFVKLIFKDGKERLDLYPDMSRKQKKMCNMILFMFDF